MTSGQGSNLLFESNSGSNAGIVNFLEASVSIPIYYPEKVFFTKVEFKKFSLLVYESSLNPFIETSEFFSVHLTIPDLFFFDNEGLNFFGNFGFMGNFFDGKNPFLFEKIDLQLNG